MWFVYGLIATWLALLAGGVRAAWQFQRGIGNRIALSREPQVVVITPVKGTSRHLAAFLGRLRNQRYGRYRIVAVVETEIDPALPVLRAAAEGAGTPMTIMVAGLSTDEGQKVHNLLHVLDRLQPEDEIVAFVDADTQPPPDWLVRLVEPLTRGTFDVVTGHRWLTPVRGDLASALTAAATNGLVGAWRIFDVVWGGTCAMHRATIERIGLRDRWRGSIVDDVHLTRIMREHGLRLLTPRSLIVPSPVEHNWRSAYNFGRRQYKFVGWYLPLIWWMGAVTTTLSLVASGCAVVLAARGDLLAIVAIGTAFILGQLRASARLTIVRKALGDEEQCEYRAKADAAVRWLAPAWIAFHAVVAWSTLYSRRLVWAGVTYDYRGHRRTKIVSRYNAAVPAAQLQREHV